MANPELVVQCPGCNAKRVKKAGTVFWRPHMARLQRYKCRACGMIFVEGKR